MKFIVLLAAITPPLVILAYGIAKARDDWKSEATWNAFLIGAVSALAALAIELALNDLLPLERASQRFWSRRSRKNRSNSSFSSASPKSTSTYAACRTSSCWRLPSRSALLPSRTSSSSSRPAAGK
jgi:hypothetical protein